MSRLCIRLSTLAAIGVSLIVCAKTHGDEPARPTVRIGVYDNRAIALAYAPSKYHPVQEKMAEYFEAEAQGDTTRMKELCAWGESSQRKLHFQGFGRFPVDDLLAHVEQRLPEVAKAEGVDVIAWRCDFAGPGVEVVDVTDALVELYDPSKRTLKRISRLKKVEPVPFMTLDRMPATE